MSTPQFLRSRHSHKRRRQRPPRRKTLLGQLLSLETLEPRMLLASNLLSMGDVGFGAPPSPSSASGYPGASAVTDSAVGNILSTMHLTDIDRLGDYPNGVASGQIVFLGGGPLPSQQHIVVPTNVDAADTTNADQLAPGGRLGLSLDGDGLTVGVWEAKGSVRDTHQEFGGRVSFGDTQDSFTNHATHVAGTIGAAGVDPNARGMAPAVDIVSYTSTDDIAEMRADGGQLAASNHSYAIVTGWNLEDTNADPQLPNVGNKWVWWEDRATYASESPRFGLYDQDARDLDQTLIDHPNLLSVWSAGNDRNDGLPATETDYVTYLSGDPGGVTGWSGAGYYLVPNSGSTVAPGSDGNNATGYDSLPTTQTAKNSLVVGAVHPITVDSYTDADVVMSDFSSWGPTDDGRIKPDVVGDGVGLYSSIATSDTAYGSSSGTSMAAPNVTGTSVLLIERYEDLLGAAPRSATVKGLLAHTAFDAGNAGPDYTYGWGVVDAAAAAQFLDAAHDPLRPWTFLNQASYGGSELTWSVDAFAGTPLKATLAWTDPAGAPQSGLDDPTSVLVNNLDIWITAPDGTVFQAWTLDPVNPTAAAQRYSGATFDATRTNQLDNIEQVVIDAPTAGTYVIHVGHAGSAFDQDFSLLVGQSPDRFEPNETRVGAAEIGIGPGIHLQNLSRHNAADEDWYQFEVVRPDQIDISLGFWHAEGNLDVQVIQLDSQGNEVVLGSGESTTDDETVSLTLDPGTYYLHVYATDGTGNTYSLSIDASAASDTRVFYVNDSDSTADVYTLAPGDDANDGLSPTTPKASVQSVLADYDLGPDDLVMIDTGTYGGSTVTITAGDEGAAYVGSPGGSEFNYGGTRFELIDSDFNLIHGLQFMGPNGTGIYLHAGTVDSSTDNTLEANVFAGTRTAIDIRGGDANLVQGNVVTGSGNYGVYLSTDAAATIQNNMLSGRDYGVYANGSPDLVVTNNDISGGTYGVYAYYTTIDANNNDIHDTETGFYTYVSNVVFYANIVHSTTAGVSTSGTIGGTDWSSGLPNDIYNNATGIVAQAGATVAFNRIHGNGIGIDADNSVAVHHNVMYRNTGAGIRVNNNHDVTISNNTLYTLSGDGVRLENASYNISLSNNILWTDAGYDLFVDTDSQQGFSSDYNNFFTLGSGTLVWWQKAFTDLLDWQVEADYDNHSIGYTTPDGVANLQDNPLFVDLSGDDYRLTDTTSTSIDAGDPASLFGQEPGISGNRINLGAYGNTELAAQSAPQFIRIEYPNYYTDWESDAGRAILWSTFDATLGELDGDVNIELYEVGVGQVGLIATVAADSGSYAWSPDVNGIVPDTDKRYWIQITSADDATISSQSREAFSVPETGHVYYINIANDADLTDNEYTAAPGDNRNTGKTATDPKANLLPVLRSYDLGPGDVVQIDTGQYIHVRNVIISGNTAIGDDEGATFTGPEHHAAVINRANPHPGSANVELDDADYVTLQHLTLTGAHQGLWVHNGSTHFTGLHLTVSNNSADGIRIESDTDATVVDDLIAFDNGAMGVYVATPIGSLSNSQAYNNGTYGFYLSNTGTARVENNIVHDNNVGIYVANAVSGAPTIIGTPDLSTNEDTSSQTGNLIYNNLSTGVSLRTTCW